MACIELTVEEATILLNLLNQASVPMTHVDLAIALRTKLQNACTSSSNQSEEESTSMSGDAPGPR